MAWTKKDGTAIVGPNAVQRANLTLVDRDSLKERLFAVLERDIDRLEAIQRGTDDQEPRVLKEHEARVAQGHLKLLLDADRLDVERRRVMGEEADRLAEGDKVRLAREFLERMGFRMLPPATVSIPGESMPPGAGPFGTVD